MGYTILKPAFEDLEPQSELGGFIGKDTVVMFEIDMYPYLRRYHCGDFGDQTIEEKSHNYSAIKNGFLIRSKYNAITLSGEHISFYIETNETRTETIVMLVHEYE